jgi:chemosensory pili system protein ChpA (sensor histidine kinase/response regulator)
MKKILIVDDDATGRQLFAEVLSTLGVEILEAESGEEALKQAIQFAPDIILLDVNLPKLGGFEVVDRLRADPELAAIPVIGISGEAGADARERALQHGFRKYLPKPVEISTLREEVRGLLS